MRQAQHTLKTLSIVTLTLLTAACGSLPPHNNTLIFAVHRKVGIDVTPTSGTNAGLTVGYSSNEFAWVPLWANDADGKPFTECDADNKEANLALMKEDPKPENPSKITSRIPLDEAKKLSFRCAKYPKFIASDDGTGDRNKDSYSVFSSFGGDLNAGAGAENTVGAKVASFFATGMAAQNLSESDTGQLLTAGTNAKRRQSQTPEQTAKSLTLQWLRKSDVDGKVSGSCIVALLKDTDPSIRDSLSKDLDQYSPEAASKLIIDTLDVRAKSSLLGVGKHADYLFTRWDGEYQKQKGDAVNKGKSATDLSNLTRNALCPAAQKS